MVLSAAIIVRREEMVVVKEQEGMIYKCSDFPFINQVSQDFVHHYLKYSWQICHSKKYYYWFERPHMHYKCSLPLIPFLYPYIVKALLQIYFYKYFFDPYVIN